MFTWTGQRNVRSRVGKRGWVPVTNSVVGKRESEIVKKKRGPSKNTRISYGIIEGRSY